MNRRSWIGRALAGLACLKMTNGSEIAFSPSEETLKGIEPLSYETEVTTRNTDELVNSVMESSWKKGRRSITLILEGGCIQDQLLRQAFYAEDVLWVGDGDWTGDRSTSMRCRVVSMETTIPEMLENRCRIEAPINIPRSEMTVTYCLEEVFV